MYVETALADRWRAGGCAGDVAWWLGGTGVAVAAGCWWAGVRNGDVVALAWVGLLMVGDGGGKSAATAKAWVGECWGGGTGEAVAAGGWVGGGN